MVRWTFTGIWDLTSSCYWLRLFTEEISETLKNNLQCQQYKLTTAQLSLHKATYVFKAPLDNSCCWLGVFLRQVLSSSLAAGTVHTDTPISWVALCNLIYWPPRLDYKAEIHVPTRGVMSIHSPEEGRKKRKKHTDMHTCINPKHLEAAVNVINDLQREKRCRPARPVLHGGSQSRAVH